MEADALDDLQTCNVCFNFQYSFDRAACVDCPEGGICEDNDNR